MRRFRLIVLALMLASGAGEVAAQEDAPVPLLGEVLLEGVFDPDPYILNVPRAGGPVDAAVLGEGCVGLIPEAPHYALTYTGQQSFRIYFLGTLDSTLVVQLPDGTYVCNDDAVGLDPAVVILDSEAGVYNIWVGTYEPDQDTWGYLMVTEIEASVPGRIITPLINFVPEFITLADYNNNVFPEPE
jgi:serine protease Do/protease YdgD